MSAGKETALVDKGTTLAELNPTRPAGQQPDELKAWLDEWHDYALAAGIGDRADANNVVRWIGESGDASQLAGLRSGKAFAVADVLTKRGLPIDRGAELAITAALAAADKGDMIAQCRHPDVVWQLYLGQLPGEIACAG